jgi:hypothetical protein
MPSFQSLRFLFSSGDTCSCAAAAAFDLGVFGASWGGTLGAPDDAQAENSPNSNTAVA